VHLHNEDLGTLNLYFKFKDLNHILNSILPAFHEHLVVPTDTYQLNYTYDTSFITGYFKDF